MRGAGKNPLRCYRTADKPRLPILVNEKEEAAAFASLLHTYIKINECLHYGYNFDVFLCLFCVIMFCVA